MKYVVAVLLGLFVTSALAEECYSDGIRVGTVQKFSKKGMMNKSWEGELVMEGTKLKGGYKTGTSGGDVWKFSTLDSEVAKVVESAMMSGHSVALKYCQANPITFVAVDTDTPYRIVKAVERQ